MTEDVTMELSVHANWPSTHGPTSYQSYQEVHLILAATYTSSPPHCPDVPHSAMISTHLHLPPPSKIFYMNFPWKGVQNHQHHFACRPSCLLTLKLCLISSFVIQDSKSVVDICVVSVLLVVTLHGTYDKNKNCEISHYLSSCVVSHFS